MRTKSLLIAAAALAATVISSEAQVYSGIVGYLNEQFPAGAFVLACNPLDDGTNTCTSVGANLPNKSTIEVWNGSGFTTANKAGGVWTPDLSIPPGVGFFVIAKTSITNTFVGSVVAPVGGSVTNFQTLTAGSFILAGSPIPFTGDLNDTNLNIGPTLPNKSTIEVWNGNGFTTANKAGGVWTPDLTITNGEGFFIIAKTTTNWVQTLPSN